jgi:hypothetical protein
MSLVETVMFELKSDGQGRRDLAEGAAKAGTSLVYNRVL